MSLSKSQNLFHLIKKTSLCIPHLKHANGVIRSTQVRYAGHSKWSNIKHIKAARDLRINKEINLYRNRVMGAIAQGNGERNPEINNGLKKIVNEALALQVPRGAIDKWLKSKNEKPENEIIVEVQGPGGCAIIVECLDQSKKHTAIYLNTILRKKGGVNSSGMLNMFDKKGIIIAHAKEGCTLDDAEEDAIEVGAEEVNEVEGDEKMLEFVTDSNDFSNVKTELEKRNYSCEDSSIQYIPQFYHELSQLDLARVKVLIKSLEELDKVVGVHSNVAGL